MGAHWLVVVSLPQFKPCPVTGGHSDREDDREEIVHLPSILEGPRIIISDFNTDILISRILIEALSLHLEVLAPFVSDLYFRDDPENHAAVSRGKAARLILCAATSIDESQDLHAHRFLLRGAFPLIGELLELGLAQVVQYGPGGRAPGGPSFSPTRITVRHFGSSTSYTAADGAGIIHEFFRIQ